MQIGQVLSLTDDLHLDTSHLQGGNLVTWRSKKQKMVARSSAEVDIRGMSHSVCELLWLKKLLRDIGFKSKGAMKLQCDNNAAIEIAYNPVQHD